MAAFLPSLLDQLGFNPAQQTGLMQQLYASEAFAIPGKPESITELQANAALQTLDFADAQAASNWLYGHIINSLQKVPEEHRSALQKPIIEAFAKLAKTNHLTVPQPPELAHHELQTIPLDLLKTDSQAYQFKYGANDEGVTQAGTRHRPWNTLLDGDPVIVHQRLNGEFYIADGHHRLDRARQAHVEGEGPEGLLAHVFRESDGYTVQDVKIIAAMKNMAQGTAKNADAAIILKEAAPLNPAKFPKLDYQFGELPNAVRLSLLSNKVLSDVQSGKLPEQFALALAGKIPNDELQQNRAEEIILRQLSQAKEINSALAH